MIWQYAWQWNELLDEPMDPLTEAQARSRHESGELYTAYHLDEDGAIEATVEVRLENGFAGVWTFDRYSRQVWHRVLDRRGDRMFMQDAYWYDYGDSTEHLLVNEAEEFFHIHLEPDGTGYQRRSVKGEPGEQQASLSLKEGADLDELWTPVPEFGEYMEVFLAGVDRAKAEEITREFGQD